MYSLGSRPGNDNVLSPLDDVLQKATLRPAQVPSQFETGLSFSYNRTVTPESSSPRSSVKVTLYTPPAFTMLIGVDVMSIDRAGYTVNIGESAKPVPSSEARTTQQLPALLNVHAFSSAIAVPGGGAGAGSAFTGVRDVNTKRPTTSFGSGFPFVTPSSVSAVDDSSTRPVSSTRRASTFTPPLGAPPTVTFPVTRPGSGEK